jgi:uncharacterized RDD family membrane protein YckC
MRFDEMELEPVTFDLAPPAPPTLHAPRLRRLAALLIDLSLFAALGLALSPLLPPSVSWLTIAGLSGFVVLVSYYYFVGTWMLWGKTIGGAIFDVRVAADGASMSLRNASLRWLGLYLSLLTGGLGFLMAALPSRLSLPDRMSGTRCV